MIAPLIEHQIKRTEKQLGERLDYLRDIADTSVSALLKFGLIMPMANHRSAAPVDAYYVARLVTGQFEDCGTCVQIEVNLAQSEGVDIGVIRAVLAQDIEALPEPLAAVYSFTEAVLRQDPNVNRHVDRCVRLFGKKGTIDVAFGIAAARIFPTVKRALGHAVSCEIVQPKVA